MNKLILALVLSLATTSFAQDPFTQSAKNEIEKAFEMQYLRGDRANRAVNFVERLMAGRARLLWEPVLGQLVIIGSADHVAHTIELLQKLDVPEVKKPVKNIDLMIYLVGAYMDAAHTRGTALPPELDSVQKEMRSAFAYKGFGLLDQIPVTVRSGSGVTDYNGILPIAAVGINLKHFYKVSVTAPNILDDGKTVAIPDFKFLVEIPMTGNTKAGESGIRTDLTVREGQKVVLGKIRLDDGDSAVFLVVTARIQ